MRALATVATLLLWLGRGFLLVCVLQLLLLVPLYLTHATWPAPWAFLARLAELVGLGSGERAVTGLVGLTTIAITILSFPYWRWWFEPPTPIGDSHGTARFADADDLQAAGLIGSQAVDSFEPQGLLLGHWPPVEDEGHRWHRPGRSRSMVQRLRYTGPAHLLTIAPTRAGKGVGAIIPNLLSFPGSILCIDPKGENARLTAQVRREVLGQTVHVLDPYGIAADAYSKTSGGTGQSAAFDPLADLDPFSLDAVDDARLVADTLVHDPPPQAGDSHWNEEARALITGLLLHQLTLGRTGERDLASLRRTLVAAPAAFRDRLETMAANPACDGVIAGTAQRMAGKSDKEFSAVLSTAQRHTHFLDGPRLRQVTANSDFRLEELKLGSDSPEGDSRQQGSGSSEGGRPPTTIYLVLPPERLVTHGRWLRLMVAQTLQTLARSSGQGSHPVLLLLDEFAALGRLEAVETAFGLMAGYGVQLWPFLQDLAQLRSLYGERAGTFLANAAVLQAFGTTDHTTAKLLADMLGQSTVLQTSHSNSQGTSSQGWFDAGSTSRQSGTSIGPTGRPLLMPDEIRRLDARQQLLFVQGQPPVLAGKLRYFDEPDMAELVDRYGVAPASNLNMPTGERS